MNEQLPLTGAPDGVPGLGLSPIEQEVHLRRIRYEHNLTGDLFTQPGDIVWLQVGRVQIVKALRGSTVDLWRSSGQPLMFNVEEAELGEALEEVS